MHDYVLEIQSDSQALIANRGVSKELVEIIERGPSGLPGVDGAPGAPGTPGAAGAPGSNAWVIEANSSYPTRPNVPSAVFIGPDSPEPYMLVGDTWINTSNSDPLTVQGNDTVMAAVASNPASAFNSAVASALGNVFESQPRALAQAARAPQIARVLDKFLAPAAIGIAVGRVGTTYQLYRGIAPGLFARYDLVLDSTEPGSYPLHQIQGLSVVAPMLSKPYGDASVASTGTWTTSTNAGAYNGGYVYSTTAGDSKTFTSPVATTIGLRLAQITNGGLYAKVSIDGDLTKADGLPSAQDEVTAGRLASTALIANGGTLNPTDRVFNSYSSSVGATNQDVRIGIATGLSATAHTVVVTNTGYALGALTSQRLYLAGFSYGTASSQPTDANVVQMPVANLCGQNSAWEHALEITPSGATTPTFVGNIHGYEVEDSFTIAIDGTATAITDGQIVSGSREVAVTRVGHLLHPQTGTTKVADTQVVYSVGKSGLTVDDTITWAVNGTLTKAYAMMPVNGILSLVSGAVKFGRAALLDYPGGALTFTGGNGDTYYGASKSAAAWVWAGKYGILMHMPDVEGYTNDWANSQFYTRVEDRNGGMTKVYFGRTWGTAESFAPGTVLHSRAIYTTGYFSSGAETVLADGAANDGVMTTVLNNSASAFYTKLANTFVTVNEAPLSFLDPRVAGVLDGSTNNDAAFTRAWALMPSGGKLFMPPGYCQASAITVPTLCNIIGAGELSVIRRATATTSDLVTIAGAKSSLKDLAVDGFIATSPAGGDAVVLNGPYQTLDNVVIYNNAASGVRVGKGSDASSAQLRNLRINLCRAYGIYTTGTTTLDGVYQNIGIGQCGFTGLRLDAGAQYLDKIHSWGNGIESASDNHGIWLASAQNKLVNCQAESNNGYGIFGGTNSAHGQSIIGGDQWGNGFAGIYLFGTRGHVIQGVTLRNNGIAATSGTDQRGSGLRLDAVTEAVVNGNSARDEGSVMAAGSYPSGYTPAFPFPGRTSTFKQTYAMTEVNACNLNSYVGNIIPASRTRSGVATVWLGAGNVTSANIT